ncbi:glycosyltransferase [uncultured Tateyamaria sp.]|uniref:glycosyltransferase n=1 Tax=uncultured Tateyamaria sp. TaxID=455651 RepID=UPI00260499EB|nr:glycosyltransferase [uncultured Tateyamaria sp.]
MKKTGVVAQSSARDHSSDHGPRILYLAHDLSDAAIWRRVEMLRLGGAQVTLAGFRRGEGALPGDALVLGRTHNARMLQRALQVLRQRLRPQRNLAGVGPYDVLLCRNLEMLALAVPLWRISASEHRATLIYEVLDIHRLMVGSGWAARGLRWLERRLCRDVDKLIVSSPGFLREYFDVYHRPGVPALLVENKVMTQDLGEMPIVQPRPRLSPAEPVHIGWFGILRCAFSLRCLDALTRASPGRYRVVLRGRPALDELTDFHDVVARNPDLIFGGPYRYPDDLSQIYGEVDLAWLVDRYDAGSNSDWLLPNRLYESGLNQVPAIALEGTEIATRLRTLEIGLILPEASEAAVTKALNAIDDELLAGLRARQRSAPSDTWRVSEVEARALVEEIAPTSEATVEKTTDLDRGGVLIVIPTLNEAAYIAGVIDGLKPFLDRRLSCDAPTRLVIADGGSTDGTVDIVTDQIASVSRFDIHLLHNSARLQSAGVNRACEAFGEDMRWLVRLDAHSAYPQDYVDVLLEEAKRTAAQSVVVAMHATGNTLVQRAIALTQNARLGNGGSAHRSAGSGTFVDHGHHALMQLAAFRTVGGYDESFSHNEDAELDMRLTKAGYKIWLTSRTRLDYMPRKTLLALARQYLNFGSGRARTVLKHRLKPRLRQMVMVAVAPAVAASALAFVVPVFALPAAVWVAACLIGAFGLAYARRDPLALAAAPIAMIMHFSWSLGFWRQLLVPKVTPHPPEPITEVPGAGAPLDVTVAVGICTFQRPSLIETLTSLDAQALPDGLRLSIIVADNDITPSAKETVATFSKQTRHLITYVHAPSGNISIARNAILDEVDRQGLQICAFIDDDELAHPKWLAKLFERLSTGGADVVVGPTRAVYAVEAPEWMRHLRIHDTQPELGPDGRPIAGHSCNVLMDLGHPALAGRRFDLDRGVSGGEDTAFFADAMRAGARLAFAPLAHVDETVPESRMTFSWLFRRRFRMGQTHGSLLRRADDPTKGWVALPLAGAKVAYCAMLALMTLPFDRYRNANLLRGALHLGTMSSLLGLRTVAIYGHTQRDRDGLPSN